MKFLLALLVVIALVFATQAEVDESVCTLSKETGPCRARLLRYYYDSDTEACKEFDYGGCNGNQNNFVTKEDCEELCSQKGDFSE